MANPTDLCGRRFPRLRAATSDVALRSRIEKWFWTATLVPSYVWLHNTQVIAALSIYALILTAASKEQAAEAAKAATDDVTGGEK